MNGFSFPVISAKERHNNKCFEDFKHYLDAYLQNKEEKRYHEYEFNRDLLVSRDAEEKQLREILPVTYPDFLNWVDGMYAAEGSHAMVLPKEIFLRKMNSVFADFSENDRNILCGVMQQSPLSEILLAVKDATPEQLKQSGLLALSAYNVNAVPV